MEALKTILYFSLFDYPLRFEEICNYSAGKDPELVLSELLMLEHKKIIVSIDGFYQIDRNVANIEKRKKGNIMAASALRKAEERARLIAKFPFVEGVAVSGSLSKGYHDHNSDIDFFVITKPQRVWLCRSFLMLYKKIFLLNSRKYFCINYFISSANLEVAEKNRFTATEIRTLIPFYGRSAFKTFYNVNGWAWDFMGPFTPQLDHIDEVNKPFASTAAEFVLSLWPGTAIDLLSRNVTVGFWKLKFRSMPESEFRIALKSTKDISKHHPLNFQRKVITSLNEKYAEVKRKHNIELQKEYV